MLDVTESPYKRAPDSPSRQLLWELSRLSIRTQQEFQDKLDRDADGREAAHRAALAQAAAEHERIRKGAERERERIEAQIQVERREREEAEQREIQRLRQEKVDRELAERKRELERAKALEAEKKKAEELRVQIEAAAAEKQRAEKAAQDAHAAKKAAAQQELVRRADEERKKAQDAAEAREQALKVQNTAVAAPPSKGPIIAAAGNPSHVAEHNRYLNIHQKLKEFRKYMVEQSKQNAQLKQQMGDFRRTIRKCVGQLTSGQAANAAPVSRIRPTLTTGTSANRAI